MHLGILQSGSVDNNIKGESEKLDWTGFLLFALGLVGITLGLDLLGESQHSAITTYSVLVVGVLLLVAYCSYAKTMKMPFYLYPFSELVHLD